MATAPKGKKSKAAPAAGASNGVAERTPGMIKVMELLGGPLVQRGGSIAEIAQAVAPTGEDPSTVIAALERPGFIYRSGTQFHATRDAEQYVAWLSGKPPVPPAQATQAAPPPPPQSVQAPPPPPPPPPPPAAVQAVSREDDDGEEEVAAGIIDKLEALAESGARTNALLERLVAAVERTGLPMGAQPPAQSWGQGSNAPPPPAAGVAPQGSYATGVPPFPPPPPPGQPPQQQYPAPAAQPASAPQGTYYPPPPPQAGQPAQQYGQQPAPTGYYPAPQGR